MIASALPSMSRRERLVESESDDDDAAGETAPPPAAPGKRAAGPDAGFSGFARGKTVSATLFKLAPVPSDAMAKVTKYVHEGAMARDYHYVGMLFGLVSPSLRRDFALFWESPWAEEHHVDVQRKRKEQERQRADAIRSYIRASSTHDADDAQRYIQSVQELIKWDDATQDTAREVIKCVSRMVQGYERRAARSLLDHKSVRPSSGMGMPMFGGHAGAAAQLRRLYGAHRGDGTEVLINSLRRATFTSDTFASLVAQEMIRAEARSGARNTSIHLSRCIDEEYVAALSRMIQVLEEARDAQLPVDQLGMPLRFMRRNLCIRHDVLVVSEDDDRATYILSVEGANKGLEGVETIKISAVLDEEGLEKAKQKKRQRLAEAPASTATAFKAEAPASADLGVSQPLTSLL